MIHRPDGNGKGNGRGNGKPPSDPALKKLFQTEFKKLDAIIANQEKRMAGHDALVAHQQKQLDTHTSILAHQQKQIATLGVLAIRQQAHLEGIDTQLVEIRRQQQADHRIQRAIVQELTGHSRTLDQHSAALAEILRRLPKRPRK